MMLDGPTHNVPEIIYWISVRRVWGPVPGTALCPSMDMPPQTITHPDLGLWEAQGASGGPANPGILWQIPISLHSALQWLQGRLEDAGSSSHPHEVYFYCLVRDIHTCVACSRSFCTSGSAHPVLPCTKEQLLLRGYGPSYPALHK